MTYREAMLAWNPGTDQIKIGPWPDQTGWSDKYNYTVGGCLRDTRNLTDDQLIAQVFIDFHTAVVRDLVPIQAAHRAFLSLLEYRNCISPDIKKEAVAHANF